MIKQVFDVESYWKVIVYYSVDYNFFNDIAKDLRKIDVSESEIKRVYDNMSSGKAKGVTLNNTNKHVSVVLFNKHRHVYDYFNSMVHEAEHVKQAMLYAYDVEDDGEPPAYTVGYLFMKMVKVFKRII